MYVLDFYFLEDPPEPLGDWRPPRKILAYYYLYLFIYLFIHSTCKSFSKD